MSTELTSLDKSLLSEKEPTDFSSVQVGDYTQTKAYKLRKYLGLGIGFLSYVLVYFHRFAPAVLSDMMASDFKVQKSELSVFSSMYFWPYGLMQPIAGSLADTFDPGKLISIANAVAALGTFLCAISNSLTLACIGRLLVGLGCSTIFVPTNKVGANWLTPQEFKYLSGIMMGVGGVGALISQSPLSYVGHKIGWKPTFYFFAILGAILSVLSFFFVKGSPAAFGYTNDGVQQKPKRFGELVLQILQNFGKVAKLKDFWILELFMFFAPGIYINVSALWGIPYLEDVYGYTPSAASNIQMALSASLIIGSPIIPVIAEKVHSRKWTVFFFVALSLISTLFLCFGTSFLGTIGIVILLFVFGCGANSSGGVVLALAKEYVDNSLSATVVGMTNTGGFIGGGLFQILSGIIIGRYGKSPYPARAYREGLWGMGIGAVAMTLLGTFLMRDPKPSDGFKKSTETL